MCRQYVMYQMHDHPTAGYMGVRKTRFKPQQCRLCQHKTSYLGFLVLAFGVRPDPAKTAALRDIPLPRGLRAVRSLLGIGSVYRRFIKNFARIAKPLQDLTCGDIRFRWEESERSAFETIKQAIVDVAALAHLQPDKEFIIDCDTCAIGLRVMLAQKDDQVASAQSPSQIDC